MSAPETSDLLAALRHENAYLHKCLTQQGQTIDELISNAEALVASMQQGRVPFLTTAADLTTNGDGDVSADVTFGGNGFTGMSHLPEGRL